MITKTLITNHTNTARNISWTKPPVYVPAKGSVIVDGFYPSAHHRAAMQNMLVAEVKSGATTLTVITDLKTMTPDQALKALAKSKTDLAALKPAPAPVVPPTVTDEPPVAAPPTTADGIFARTNESSAEASKRFADVVAGDQGKSFGFGGDVSVVASIAGEDALDPARSERMITEVSSTEGQKDAEKEAVSEEVEETPDADEPPVVAPVEETPDVDESAEEDAEKESAPAEDEKAEDTPEAPVVPEMTDAAAKLAKEHGLTDEQLATIQPSGSAGQLTKQDVKSFIAALSAE